MNVQLVRIADGRGRDDAWTDRRRAVKALRKGPLALLELLRPAADIVPAGVAKHVVHRVLLRHVPARLGDDERQLGLVVARAVLCDLGDVDLGGVWPIEGGSRLGEEDGDLRDGHLGLFGVVVVIETDAANDRDLVHRQWGQELLR